MISLKIQCMLNMIASTIIALRLVPFNSQNVDSNTCGINIYQSSCLQNVPLIYSPTPPCPSSESSLVLYNKL